MEQLSAIYIGKTPAKTILHLSWPAILEQFLLCLTSLTDTAMVGSIGATATAAISINISTVWLINGLMTALSTAFMFMIAHFIGEKKTVEVKNTVHQSITASILLGALLMIITFLLSPYLSVWLGAEPEVIPDAQKYLFIYAFGLIPQCIGLVLSAVLRAAGNTKLPLIANIASNALNVIGNYFLIYTPHSISVAENHVSIWGAGLGVSGAAVSTALSQYLLAFLLITIIYCHDTPVRIKPQGSYRIKGRTWVIIGKIGLPVALERSTICFGQIVLTSMISGLGTISLAVHYLTNETEGLLYLPAYGFSSTATTLIGQSLGAKDHRLADQFAKLICLINTIAIAALCIPVFLWSKQIISLFTPDAEVIGLGAITLKLAAATEVFFSLFLVVSGICRGSGDVQFPLIVSFIGMWVIRVGLVYFMAYPMGLGVIGVWIAIGIDTVLRSILCFFRMKSGKWKTPCL